MHKKLEERYKGEKDVVLFHLQTVFEGEQTNTPERGPQVASSHGITVPVGFDAHVDGEKSSTYMRQYGTGGTPWTTIIDKKGIVRVNSFTPEDVDKLAALIDGLRRGK